MAGSPLPAHSGVRLFRRPHTRPLKRPGGCASREDPSQERSLRHGRLGAHPTAMPSSPPPTEAAHQTLPSLTRPLASTPGPRAEQLTVYQVTKPETLTVVDRKSC